MTELTAEKLIPVRFSEQIASRIDSLILSSEFKPGDKLPSERELAESFGVSRSAIREALKLLAERGLVKPRMGQGTFVCDPGVDNVISSLTVASRLRNGTTAHIDEARLLLEVPIAGLSAERATPADMEKMEAAIGIMDKTLKTLQDPESLREFVEADLDFHIALAAATQNPFILILSNSIVDILHQDRLLKDQPTLRTSRSVRLEGHQYHKQILECVRRGDPDGAMTAMRKHLQYHATVKRQKDDPSQLSESLADLAASSTNQEQGD